MDLQLKGKNAIILGGTRGIGRSIAETLANEGANVAICARNTEQVRQAVSDLSGLGVKATGAAVDITDADGLKSWVASVSEAFGSVDILVSNAGAMAQGMDATSWQKNFELDLLGAVNAFEAAKPHLLKSAEGSGDAAFILISSVSAAQADNASSYGPIKAALIHTAKGLAREHAAAGLRVNTVSPGMVFFEDGIWGMVKKNAPEFFEQANSRNPKGRCATPQEVADAAVFLASPVSSYTTGVNLIVDGALSNRVNF